MMKMNNPYHRPVLLQESIKGLSINPAGIYVDATFGGGGHSREILRQLNTEGRLYAFDTDPDVLSNVPTDERFTLISENFRYMKRFLRLHGVRQVDGILADLGVSSHQFDEAERGFSIRFEGKLDMRMNPQSNKTAFQVVNTYPEEELGRIFREYGELKSFRRMASLIVEYRKNKSIETTTELREILKSAMYKGKENKLMAQVFQALRIEVNDELVALKEMLIQVPDILKVGGRLCVISYHSLEDRPVKRFIRNGLFEGEPERDMYGRYKVPLRKVGKFIVPSEEEIKQNNRARSAKLRIAERV